MFLALGRISAREWKLLIATTKEPGSTQYEGDT